jgi:hypothetical protein
MRSHVVTGKVRRTCSITFDFVVSFWHADKYGKGEVATMKVDRELSHRVAGVAGDEPQSGWRTACLALRSDSQLEMGFYVEGWAVIPDNHLVIEHAWIELAGRIVDPTRWASELAYYPALRFDRDQLLDPVVDCAKLPLGWHSSVSLQDNPAYQQASQDARALAQSRLAQAKEAV